VDPTPSQFRRKWGTDRHHLPTRHPEPGSSRVGGRPADPGPRVGPPGPAKPHGQSDCQPRLRPPRVRPRLPHRSPRLASSGANAKSVAHGRGAGYCSIGRRARRRGGSRPGRPAVRPRPARARNTAHSRVPWLAARRPSASAGAGPTGLAQSTALDCCEWHASGTAGEVDPAQPGGVGSTVIVG
jgi:hypothetical protein